MHRIASHPRGVLWVVGPRVRIRLAPPESLRTIGSWRLGARGEIAKAVYSEMGRLPEDAREELEVTKVYDPYFGTTSSATHIVVPEIDRETCRVTLDR